MTDSPVYQHSRFRVIEEQRQDVQRRAEAAEENFRSVQKHLKETLAQVKQLEGRLAMNENENESTSSDGELQALRDQLRETSERLHKAEVDNNALRQRMTLRQQELDEARQFLPTAGTNINPAELKSRLEEAEMRTAEMSHEIERLESELDYTNSKFHMTKLSEALREFDNDMDETTELDEPPIVIHSVSAPSKQQRAG
jgi:chromosome segregation ATPase